MKNRLKHTVQDANTTEAQGIKGLNLPANTRAHSHTHACALRGKEKLTVQGSTAD